MKGAVVKALEHIAEKIPLQKWNGLMVLKRVIPEKYKISY